ncbi:MAG: chemotaxis protein CheC [Candidatus Firestonebacteria bacterium]|nr:chemotaxis protein CheC [Candidatus Firestonebacteria bacterium]
MNDPSEINAFYKDAFQELGNIGAGNAATALSQMVGRTISTSVPKVMIIPIEKVPEVVDSNENIVAGIYLKVYGDLPAKILVTFEHADLLALTDLLMGQPVGAASLLNEMRISALKELGTILTGSFLNALAKFLDLQLIPTVPALAIDTMLAILNTLLVELSQDARYALLIQTEIFETETRLTGNIFLIPEADALDTMVKAIQKAAGVIDAG